MKSVKLTVGTVNNKSDGIALGFIAPESKYADDQATLTNLSVANNVDIGDNNIVSRRDGRTLLVSASSPHSLFTVNNNTYFVEASILKKLNSNNTTTIVTTLSANIPLTHIVINQEVVVSNGIDIGWLSGITYDQFESTGGDHTISIPAGQWLALYRGTLLSASGDVIYLSKPYNVTTCDKRVCALPMGGYIRMLGCVEDGFYVGTDKGVGFVSGTGVDDFKYEQVDSVCPPNGCFNCFTEQEEDGLKNVVSWASTTGIHIGQAGGVVKNLSEENVSMSKADNGYMFRREREGSVHYMAIMQTVNDGNINNERNIEVNSQED